MTSHPKSKRAQKLSTTLPGIMRDKGWERKLDQHRVFLAWEDLVDETTAEHSRPLKVVKDVLWLEVENSSWMQQIQYQKILLLETLNDYLKVSRFSDIRFAVEEKKKEEPQKKGNPLRFIPPPAAQVEQFEKQVGFIKDEKIRDSLIQLWYLAHACKKE